MQHLQPNTTLQGGKYRIERVLGQGGFGITYLALNTAFEEYVAIKEFFIKDENVRDGNSVTMPNTTKSELFNGQKDKFKKEARRMFRVRNEHIVKVYDLFEENGTAYYVMDYIDGESLAERMKRTGSVMTEAEVRGILSQVLEALKEVHQNEIWHLDLKPSNIMLDKQGQAYLIDFGASKQIRADGSFTTSTALCYTPGYAPNEQIGQMYDRFGPWTDIYALGATIYNLLTNKKPPMAIDIEENEEDVFDFPDAVSNDMRSLVVWMMQPKRKKRPQSTDEVIGWLTGGPDPGEKTLVVSNNSVNQSSALLAFASSQTRVLSFPVEIFTVNGISFKMIRVTGGTFMMGKEGVSTPVHQVTLTNDYYIGETEVTQELWKAVMGSNPSHFKSCKLLPVECVSWNECRKFINKLKSLTGFAFRLPTEAEWEFAARGGNVSKGFAYSGSDNIDDVAWYNGNSELKTHEVGTKLPNELGIYDMSGNVWEWCQDWYDRYSSNSQTNPEGPTSGSFHICRGGSVRNYDFVCRVEARARDYSSFNSNNLGLRLAL